ncbi:excinuclease ABC subunit UvrA [Algiphilus aromaticivorans]|uniref:excinuclease ABC subunit UvrA n=1 Tax=Algiphilus aromaticivorans TaxID=382454 RepID=UPI0005C232E6|nr:excinuclease ABC subunit UvrA [Algiphilus aromaticivorans]
MADEIIRLRGARQNNLKNLDLELRLGELTVVTGPSGSGKSSLAFGTIYAEGQRRYVETFSPYARQFLDRMDKPAVDAIEGIPPAIAIDQTNPVKSSRSTVGTMTELNDHLKLLFARAGRLFCQGCGREVRRDSPDDIVAELLDRGAGRRALIAFDIPLSGEVTEDKLRAELDRQGYNRVETVAGDTLRVTQDRVRLQAERRDRITEAVEAALRAGQGHLSVLPLDDERQPSDHWRFSERLHCPDCDRDYGDPIPNTFSFNSPMGACDTCRGFGRVMGIDYRLVIPDENKSLAEGAIKPWQTESYLECQRDLIRHCERADVPTDVPWKKLEKSHRDWVIRGDADWSWHSHRGGWYGVQRFFDWLESRAYKMHIRVLLSRYRSYDQCPACRGARLKPEALLWRVGSKSDADAVLEPAQRFMPAGARFSEATLQQQPGLNIADIMGLPLARAQRLFRHLHLPAPLDAASDLLLEAIRGRTEYLVEVGLDYLTLDRQSRTLSGGEVQRINLTTALGTSLVNTLFVLDEPSIGLHPRDMDRIIGVMHRLRDAGNTLLVVEHDPQVMHAADRVLDIGPGPGERGGEIVFQGTPAELMRAEHSLTADYLSGRRQVVRPHASPAVAGRDETKAPAARECLRIRGAAAHNLKHVDVDLPLNRLVVVTGVSGSGKSTLIAEVLYRALCEIKGHPGEAPGAHKTIAGHERIDDVVLIDQSAIGRTTRSTPASYVGAFDAIRKIFAAQPEAKARGYTLGTFSFNAGQGRCPTCGGNGFEHVEMQFLSDVYLRCADCDGRRFRPEVLEVTLAPSVGCDTGPRSIAEVLEMTVSRAVAFFGDYPEVLRGLEPLQAVGLGYMALGQPVPTLSGGEAQRLKLAGHLAKAGAHRAGREHLLFLFDEPTTGLHMDDVATLLIAFRRLLDAGHSMVVIEHNQDVMAAADWIIDMGPEGGDRGGELVAAGTPEAIMAAPASHTGQALRDYLDARARIGTEATRAGARSTTALDAPIVAEAAVPAPGPAALPPAIAIHHAREHNLQNVDIRIPRNRLTVITGLSGSGKSTVAFDIVFREGQRRYLESLNAYARQFVQPASRPDVDAVFGIPPTVAIEQRTSRGGRKSTVATMTELYHFLRLLFVKLGTQYCPDCEVPIRQQTPEAIRARILREARNRKVTLLAPMVVARKGYYTELAQWAARKGFATLRVDGDYLPTDNWPRLARHQEHDIDLPVGTLKLTAGTEGELDALIARALEFGQGTLKLATARGESILSTERACPGCGCSFPELDPRLFSYNSKHGWCGSCFGTGLALTGFDEDQTGEENEWLEDGEAGEVRACAACQGRRLKPEALAVRFQDWSIADYTELSVKQAEKLFGKLKLKEREAAIARDILPEIRARLDFLRQVGLDYLSLDRAAPTLSGGEAQRIRIAAQLGSNLQGVCYILDEPTIGLHPRDNRMLLDTLGRLEGKGNTILVVEHDEETIRRAEHVVDLGPGAGVNGGRVVAEGSVAELIANPDSITGRCLADPIRHPLLEHRRSDTPEQMITVRGATLHNLQGMDVAIPLERMVCVTGVSGSGKSSLLRGVLHDNLRRLTARRAGRKPKPQGCDAIEGWQTLERVLEVDQTPIGKTPRSCPATYIGFWDEIRNLFARTEEARLRGYTAGRFSFNTKEGRCPACEGQGARRVEMNFLPDVSVPCEVCDGDRFSPETLAVTYGGQHIGEVLKMSVDEAVDFFSAYPKIHHALELMRAVGLGYLTLGQPSPTLSGGEAQRIKLVTELTKARPDLRRDKQAHTLYILDEPTVGLHMADVERLIRVLHRLVDAGHSVILIEHNLDVIAEADWLIDLGPEGGDAGGRVVVEGPPEQVVRTRRKSETVRVLKAFLAEHQRRDGPARQRA